MASTQLGYHSQHVLDRTDWAMAARAQSSTWPTGVGNACGNEQRAFLSCLWPRACPKYFCVVVEPPQKKKRKDEFKLQKLRFSQTTHQNTSKGKTTDHVRLWSQGHSRMVRTESSTTRLGPRCGRMSWSGHSHTSSHGLCCCRNGPRRGRLTCSPTGENI